MNPKISFFGLVGGINAAWDYGDNQIKNTFSCLLNNQFNALQSTECIADPLFVSAILTLVLSIHNKLAYLGYSFVLPWDPFLYPYAFSQAISHYIQSTAPPPIAPPQNNHTFSASHHVIHISTPLIPAAPPLINILSVSAAAAATQSLPIGAILTREVVCSLDFA
ncbi:hypothetical protein CVT25_005043 [Psilocybe cyanescens]|uniref:Uncharacterized protein n=1 Tax=Psilocybe cyanescens TaxID=93625 RepID=A0A409XIX5_PSICY|nr:hypothetical protein CVT25_005043 [Psilocybe cyanescens]